MAKLFAIVLLALVSSKTLPAQRTERTIFQFQHAGWTAKDGAPAPTYAFTQTADGFLWMATVDGLYRFDGIRFEPYQLPSNVTSGLAEIRSLMGTPDGGLWIGLNTTGAAFLKDGRTVSYGVPQGLPAGAVFEFTVDREGTLWAGTLNGPAKFDGSRWHAVGKDSGFSAKSARVLFVDRAGTLWVASEDSLFFLIRGEKTFKAYREHAGYINSIGQTPDGALWVAQTIDDAPPGNGKTRLIRPMPHAPGTDDKRIPPIFEIFGVSSALVDHVGSLWIKSNNNQGLFRVRNPAPLETSKPSPFEQPYFENFNAKDGLTGDAMTTAQLEDRDGNLWFSSNLGVDRFRESDVVPIVNLGGFMPLARGDNGEVLSFHTDFPNQYLLHLHGLTATRQPFKAYPTAVYRDANGVLWMGGYEEFSSYANGRWTQYGFPKGVIRANVRAIAGERSGAMWVGIPGHQVYRFEHGEWTHFGNRQDLPKFNVLFLYADSQGRIWFCYPEGKSPIKVAVLDRDHVKTFSAADGLQVANSQVIAEGAGHLWIGGDRGLALFRNNRFQTVHADEGDALIGITGIVETANGDLWLNARPGIVHILAAEVGRGIADPAYPMHCENFDVLDGLTGRDVQISPLPTVVESTDKRLWFLTLGGIFQIDPNHLLRNSTPPSVIIRSVGSGPRTNEDTGPAVFAAGTTNVQIAYTAPNLSVPERVRFRYKLEGSDHEWQDAGTRRQAFYTNLRPRHYRFQVTARNNDGDWNTVGASVDFTIEPAWYQTNWFLGLCIALGLFSAWSLYRIRVWQVERAITARFDERLSERTRMARELHDTFLQTIQGSKFVVDDGLEEPLDPEKMHRALGQVSGWLDQAITEGRAALNSLRASTTLKNELAPALRRAAESGVVPDGMTISVSVIGDIRELHPIVRDELYRIGNEAIQNAKAHSHGSVLAIDLSYGQDLAMHIRDNGVGIDPRYAMSGREGHHGLQGMRERASRIQGRLTILSSAESGTDISVIVPGSVSFLQLETGILADLRKLFLRAKRDRGAL